MFRIILMVLRNILIVPWAYWKLAHYAKHTDEYSMEEKYRHIQYILKRAVKTGNIDLKVTGLENIPTENGFLLYSNHQGLFDVLAIAATCDMPIGAILKQELYKIDFLRYIGECTYSFPMNREDIRQSMQVIQGVSKALKEGKSYLIFPEGTRSKDGNHMLEFHGGSFKCALKAKCPIVPIALLDCFKVLDQKGIKPVKVQIHYLKPIPYEEYAGMKTVELAELVKTRIQEAMDANIDK